MIIREEQIKTLIDNGWIRSPEENPHFPEGLWICPIDNEEVPFKMAWDAFRYQRFQEQNKK